MDTNAQLGTISICRMPGGPGPAAAAVAAAGVLRTPSLVAVTVAVPGATPVTPPFGATAAIVGSLLTQRTGRRTTPPRASLATARSANGRLTAMFTRRGDTSSDATPESTTVTRATGAVPVTIAVPVLPPAAVAVTEAAPAFTPFTVPSEETLATVESLEAQPRGRGSTCPSAARAVAARATVPPTVMDAVAGVTLIFARVAAGGLAIDRMTSHNPTAAAAATGTIRSEEHTSELQSQSNLVCRLLLEKKKKRKQSEREERE